MMLHVTNNHVDVTCTICGVHVTADMTLTKHIEDNRNEIAELSSSSPKAKKPRPDVTDSGGEETNSDNDRTLPIVSTVSKVLATDTDDPNSTQNDVSDKVVVDLAVNIENNECEIYSLKFRTPTERDEHDDREHPIELIRCDQCSFSCETAGNLKVHRQQNKIACNQ